MRASIAEQGGMERKSEIRENSKFKTAENVQNQRTLGVWNIWISDLDFVSDFGFRI
jgi:hypothetical protein